MTIPSQIPDWAMNNVTDPITGQPNVVTPPIEKQNNGWSFGEFPPRQWFNWLGRYAAQWIRYLSTKEAQNITTNGNGVGLFPIDDALITLTAVDKTDPTHFIFAIGYKEEGVAPVLNVILNDTLTLDSGTITGDQPILGGTASNIIVYGNSKPSV